MTFKCIILTLKTLQNLTGKKELNQNCENLPLYASQKPKTSTFVKDILSQWSSNAPSCLLEIPGFLYARVELFRLGTKHIADLIKFWN